MKSREAKRKEAEERKAAWNALTPEEQLKILKRRPGKSEKRIAQIKEQIEKRKAEAKLNKKEKAAKK